ncbi:ParB N-terminal domain-containing protein [Pararhizobium sp. LjRoot235]|uniref:ParB N-terminal domain-containing protein n=1 Tax=Pararhizobium sp. LjRoot235 TaxID=3342291 RepID=UPI003ECCA999
MITTIPIEQIEVERRLRDISEAQVETLTASIAVVGLLNPITVYESKLIHNGRPVEGYGLVAGAHRIEACKRLGMLEIPAYVVALSDLERQIAECDENLCGPALTQSEKALFTRRRKDAYEALHPEAKAQVRQGHLRQGAADDKLAAAFTTDTAAKTGESERSIQRSAERGAKIIDQALAAVRGTKLDTGAYLDSLRHVPKAEQLSKVKSDLAAQKPLKARPPASPPLQLSSGPINPINRCVMRHREFVFELARAVPAESWPDLVAELRRDLADIEGVLERRRHDG